MADDVSVEIAGTVGGISIGAIAVIAIFASDSIWIAAPVVASLAILGIALGYFNYKKTE